MNKTHLGSLQKGMTIIELMIAIALGLILVAVAVQMFISAQASYALQRSLADLQDNGIFGLEYLAKDVRKANLGASTQVLDSKVAQGGLILSQGNVTPHLTTNGAVFEAANFSSSGSELSQPSNFKQQNSDQLTVQFKATQSLYDEYALSKKIAIGLTSDEKNQVVGYDCEGNKITLDEVTQQTYIIQRYFVRPEASDATELVLACAAGRYKLVDVQNAQANTTEESFKAINLNGFTAKKGEIILKRVEHFHYLLGVAEGVYTEPKKFRYLTVKDYKALSANVPHIRSIKLGLVLRSHERVSKSSVSNENSYQVLDQKNLVLTSGKDQFLRQVVTQTVALRNALGEDER